MTFADRAWNALAHAFVPVIALVCFGITQFQAPAGTTANTPVCMPVGSR